MNKSDTDKSDNPFVVALSQQTECAPNVEKVSKNVCSTQQAVDELRNWLKTATKNPERVVDEAKQRTGCDSESCLYKKIDVLDKKDLDQRFNPAGPWNSTAWLSNSDIDGVLALYAKKFPRFKHVEFQMRDFKKQGGKLSRLDWCETAKKYDMLGCVLNTDLTGGPGEHWVAFNVDFKNGTVEYFDSAGQVPHGEFSEFAVETAHKLSECTGRTFHDHMVSKIEHQKENTECGVYSLYYILSRLNGVRYTAFEFKRVPDDVMVEFRKFLFRHSS